MVVNISCSLSPIAISILSKGLSFCPNSKPDRFQLDLTHFFRRLRLQVWADTKESPNAGLPSSMDSCVFSSKELNLVPKNDFTPALNVPPIETFIELVHKDVSGLREIEYFFQVLYMLI